MTYMDMIQFLLCPLNPNDPEYRYTLLYIWAGMDVIEEEQHGIIIS